MDSGLPEGSRGSGDWISGNGHVCRLEGLLSPSSYRFEILEKERLSESVVRMVIRAPLVAASARPGQFLLIRPQERSERIPLTIIFQEVGATTRELGALEEGQQVKDLVGPLGTPSDIRRFGTVACVGGGVGIAVMLPVARALKHAGNRVVGIIGARTKDLLILEREMREASDELIVMTDDGSYGSRGLVTEALAGLAERERVDHCYAIGPLPMMHAVCRLTREKGIPTTVSLDPVMVDGTGMCGGCRVTVGGEAKFTCVDGPEFDGHLVDWDTLRARKTIYREEERAALEARSGKA
jgi:ferredoxin--NADP+ reductase